MGSSQELPSSKRKRRNSDCISNYVDRVRICDSKSVTSESVYSKASSQKSGWRQKSYSSIDLSTSCDIQPGAGAFRYRDFEAQDDLYIKNGKNGKNKENIRDYDDIYNINPKAQGLKGEIIKEHNKIHHDRRDNEVCSLRRTKSLAVIREETFNDLNIAAPNKRRSQLIPRAKLIDRQFLKHRLSFALDEGLSLSLDSNLTSESIKNGSNRDSNFFSWNCDNDKSDLGSIDSNFFKNSLHQGTLLEKSSTLQTDTTSTSTATSKIVSRAEIHNESDNKGGRKIISGTASLNVKKSENNNTNNNNSSSCSNTNENESTVNINEDTESGITIIEIKDRKQLNQPASSVISYDSIYLSSESSDKQTVLGDTISNLEDIDSKIKDFEKIIQELNLIGENGEKSDSIIDNLYSQVAKGGTGVIGDVNSLLDLSATINEPVLNSDTLSKYSDYISKGTLERLTILSTGFTSNNRKSAAEKSNKSEKDKRTRDNREFQYASLPDVDISKLLRDSELIDAKLRDDVSIELLEPYPDYDLLSTEANSNNNNSTAAELADIPINNQNDSIEVNTTIRAEGIGVNLNSEPTSIEEENPKGAPSIELVLLPTKELNSVDNTKREHQEIFHGKQKQQQKIQRKGSSSKIYLPDLGLELDYENSIASVEEDEESEEDFGSPTTKEERALKQQQQQQQLVHHHYHPTSFNLVTISGRKVIVDELAAKTEQQQHKKEHPREQSLKGKSLEKTTPIVAKRKETKSNSFSSSTSSLTSANSVSGGGGNHKGIKKAIVGKLNGVDNRQANIDKKPAAKKIKVPESKQPQSFADSSCADKEIIFIKNPNSEFLSEGERKGEVVVQLNCVEKGDRNSKKDLALQQKNNSKPSNNMPRPQLLNIIDSKNSAPKQSQKERSPRMSDVRIVTMTSDIEEKPLILNETEKEFLHKVDSVRNYWSKMVDNEGSEIKGSNLKTLSKAFTKSHSDIPSTLRNEEFQSFFPTVEIVELNGETQAALVTSRKLNDEEFDHVRYKVMRSELFQKNLANNNRKETQFDGLMQYLQNYSFQELLANNNVVIIEPVRTKIEKISDKPNKAQSAVCKITNGAAAPNRNGSNNLKKHFFYHPIRVNKELYEDELPVPDTVRNVRKMFEDSLHMGCEGKKLSENSKMSKSSDNLKPRKTIRYLTIDTSFDNNLATSKWDSISLSSGVSSAADLGSPCECNESSQRNVSSGNGSKENLDNNDDDNASHFVATDVLEKLRERGSSITYYGGRKAATSKHANANEKNNQELMARNITKEGQKCNCHERQTRGLSSTTTNSNGAAVKSCGVERMPKKINGSDYTGLKFKLVKSNSCSSRLELAGTGLEKSSIGERNAVNEMRNLVHGQDRQLHVEDKDEDYDAKLVEDLEQEETVKDMIYKLETKNNSTTKPRIIESRCIEKIPPSPKVTINNQILENSKPSSSTTTASSFISPSSSSLSNIDPQNEYEENVTVNNHISISNKASELNNPPPTILQHENGSNDIGSKVNMAAMKPKVVRNKNVDLALLAAVNKKKENGKNSKGLSSSDTESIFSQNDSLNEYEISNNAIKASRDNNIPLMPSVEMVKHQDKINSSSSPFQHPPPSSDANEKSPKSAMASARGDDKPIRMVNWGTVGTINKEYIMNDNRLVQHHTKTFEEMEFEEFEVAGEHYDSLNSK